MMLTLTSPLRTWAHALPAGAKMAALGLWTVGLFSLTSLPALAGATLAVAALVLSCGWRFALTSARMLRPLWPFVALAVGWYLLWKADPAGAATIVLRMLAAIGAANLVTMTTRLSDMIAVIAWLARPLAALGLSPRMLALAVALVIRFIPVMLQRMDQIRDAWRARSPRRPSWRLLLPAVLAALDDADQVAEALRARGGA